MKLLPILLLTACVSAPMECAPNGTCWPASYQPINEVRIMRLAPDAVNETCGNLLAGRWELQEGKRYLACTILLRSSQPVIYLPTHIRPVNAAQGWTMELLERYERANADGVTVYPETGPARRVRDE